MRGKERSGGDGVCRQGVEVEVTYIGNGGCSEN